MQEKKTQKPGVKTSTLKRFDSQFLITPPPSPQKIWPLHLIQCIKNRPYTIKQLRKIFLDVDFIVRDENFLYIDLDCREAPIYIMHKNIYTCMCVA